MIELTGLLFEYWQSDGSYGTTLHGAHKPVLSHTSPNPTGRIIGERFNHRGRKIQSVLKIVPKIGNK